ncbi:MAG: ABC transporter permease [Parachlamydiaceae bacterium]|nr:ABC transporter permease [Parachlamydiaceae bacterium]
MAQYDPYWKIIWKQFKKHTLGLTALGVVLLFCLVAIYAPFLASSKPLVVQYNGEWFFPLFRYLFYTGFFTKHLDIFFNVLIFTMPIALIATTLYHQSRKILRVVLISLTSLQVIIFCFFVFSQPHDPSADKLLNEAREQALKTHPLPNWDFDLKFMSPYARLNLILRAQQLQRQQQILKKYSNAFYAFTSKDLPMPTLWQLDYDNEISALKRYQDQIEKLKAVDEVGSKSYLQAEANLLYMQERRAWIESQIKLLKYEIMPLLSSFHWEDDAGGSQSLNRVVSLWELSRINHKDLLAALIFGVRISLVVGIMAVSIALAIALPIGSYAGFYGGKLDIVVSRLLEIWESMPTFFMLLMVVAIMQNKSIFLVILVIGLFGWTTFSRFIRGEFFKQRHLSYVEACRAIGLNDSRIMFSHILPNAIPPVLTLLPFSIMGAITSEAGLSFLGLGEEGSCSWGVLMDEGRTAFPAESYLLWPPALLLITLLIAIALVGDSLRDAIDPKMHR